MRTLRWLAFGPTKGELQEGAPGEARARRIETCEIVKPCEGSLRVESRPAKVGHQPESSDARKETGGDPGREAFTESQQAQH